MQKTLNMSLLNILFFVSAFSMGTTKACKPIKAIFFVDLTMESKAEAEERMTRMSKVTEELYSKLPSDSEFKLVLFGERSKTFASSLSFLKKGILIKETNFFSPSVLQEEIFNYFTVSKYTHNSEIAFLLTANDKIDYEIPYVLQYMKKLTILNFGNNRNRKVFSFASSPKHVFHLQGSDTETAIRDLLNQTCTDSQLICDKNQYNEGYSIKCQDCTNVCSSTVVKISCIGYCPYFKYPSASTEAPAEVLTEASRYPTEDHKYVVIVVVLSAIFLIVLICGVILYKKGLQWVRRKCRPGDGEAPEELPLRPAQLIGPQESERVPVEETNQTTHQEYGMGQPLLNNGDREDRTGRDEMANSPTDTSTELDAMANSHTDTSTDEDQCHSEHVTGNGQTCISFKEINANINTFDPPMVNIRDEVAPRVPAECSENDETRCN